MEFNAEIKPDAAPPQPPNRPKELLQLDKKTYFSLVRKAINTGFLVYYVILMVRLLSTLAISHPCQKKWDLRDV